MDNFMSKLSQKINAQDSIKANLMAEAAEKEQMKKQLEEYATLLQDMRVLYEKQEKSLEELKEVVSRSDEFTHKECVKVYRNVQALLEKQDALLEEKASKLQASIEGKDLAADFEEVNATTEKNTKDIKVLLVIILFLLLVNTSYLVATVVTSLLNIKLF